MPPDDFDEDAEVLRRTVLAGLGVTEEQVALSEQANALLERAQQLERIISQEQIQNLIQRAVMPRPERNQGFRFPLVPLRQNIDYMATARRTFLIDPLPHGSIPNYEGGPDLTADKSKWPDYCEVGVILYNISDDYVPYQVESTGKQLELRCRGTTGCERGTLLVFSDVDAFEKWGPWASYKPKSMWERLGDDD